MTGSRTAAPQRAPERAGGGAAAQPGGAGQLPPALLLAHGAAGTVRAHFGTLTASFRQALPAFGPDFPGSGSTPLPAGALDLDDLADRLVAAAGPVRRFPVLGYSMGCAVAVRAAIRHPGRVSALVLTAGAPRADEATRGRIARWQQLLSGDRTELARFVMSVMLSGPFRRRLTDRQQRDFLDLFALGVPPGAREQMDLVQRIDVTGELAEVAAPALVIGTRHDRLVSPDSMREYADAIPNARWASLDSGHAVAIEAPAAWACLVEDFLTAMPAH